MSHIAGSRILVLSSLPQLPRFDRAQRLPISRETLQARLALLAPADARELDLATAFLWWQRLRNEPHDEDVVQGYRQVMHSAGSAGLRQLVTYRLGVRTLVAALRRRRLGRPAPRLGECWGIAPWTEVVTRRYGEPDFGLAHRLPWLPEARRRLESGDAIGLERLLFGLVWDELDRVACRGRLGLNAILAYVFKWDLVDRWLAQDTAAAVRRLEQLSQEALQAHGEPFVQRA